MGNFRKNLFYILALFIILSASRCVIKADEPAPVSLVKNVNGNVEYVPGGSSEWSPLKSARELPEGDKLKLSEGAEAKVCFYNDFHSELIKGPCKIMITPGGCALLDGNPDSIQKEPGYVGISATRPMSISIESFSGFFIRSGFDFIKIISPDGKEAELRPVFRWMPVESAEEYKLIVSKSKGEEIYSATVKENELPCPDDFPALEFDQAYKWKVIALQGGEEITRGSASFKIVSSDLYETTRQIEEQTGKEIADNPMDTGPYLTRLAFYMDNSLLSRAIMTCRELLKIEPDNENIHYWMGRLYEAKGWEKEAREELEKAGIFSNPGEFK